MLSHECSTHLILTRSQNLWYKGLWYSIWIHLHWKWSLWLNTVGWEGRFFFESANQVYEFQIMPSWPNSLLKCLAGSCLVMFSARFWFTPYLCWLAGSAYPDLKHIECWYPCKIYINSHFVYCRMASFWCLILGSLQDPCIWWTGYLSIWFIHSTRSLITAVPERFFLLLL